MWDISYGTRVTITVVLAFLASIMILVVAVSFRKKERIRCMETAQLMTIDPSLIRAKTIKNNSNMIQT